MRQGVCEPSDKTITGKICAGMRVSRFTDLRDVIVPFFQDHQLQTSKKVNFAKFVKVLRLMEERKHLTVSGLIEIGEISETMNHQQAICKS